MSTAEDREAPIDLDPDPTLSTTEVGALFEVHPSTVKRWCERGQLECQRTEGGHRRIRLSQALTRHPEGVVARELANFGPDAGSVWLAERSALSGEDFEPARRLTEEWLRTRDFHRIKDLLVYLGRNHGDLLPHLLDAVTREVMRGIGQWWEEGRLGIGGEHLASETVTEALFELRRDLIPAGAGRGGRADQSDAGRMALVGCAEGERHSIGANAVRLLLEQRGWGVRYLGADVPVDSWSELQKEYDADLVCISFSSIRVWAEVLHTVRRLAETYDPARPYLLAIGGGMVRPTGADGTEIPAEELKELRARGPFEDLGIFGGAAEFTEWLADGERQKA